VKVRLVAEQFDLAVNVDVTQERYAELGIKPGELVYVSPRKARVFVPEYSI
jgi:sulfate transport system ATP-binding protein